MSLIVDFANLARISPGKASGTDGRALTSDNLFLTPKAVADAMAFNVTSPGGYHEPFLNTGPNRQITLTMNTSIGPATGALDGLSGVLIIAQDSVGGRTLTWGAFWDFGPSGPPTLSTAANAIDYVFYVIAPNGSKAICSFRSGT